MKFPLVAIVGAPNVGKSTLFNRLVGRRQAIVTDEPGVTRDRLYGLVEHHEGNFEIVDTGGLTPNTDAPFAREIEAQADAALERAALILYVVDARAGATAIDQELAARLRRRPAPTLLIANKIDTPKQDPLLHELHRLGLGDPVAVSAEHGQGVEELVETISALLRRGEGADSAGVEADVSPAVEGPEGPIRVAIVGRPNVGKSSIFNRLVGEERAVVSDIAGTTRDSIDTLLERDGRSYLLIDTAGMRRRGKLRENIERFSVHKARQSLERCDVAVLVLDASEPFAAQDAHIAGYVVEAKRPMVVVVNKWDLPDDRENAAKEWEERVRHRLRFAKNVPILLVSAKTGQRVTRILDDIDEQYRLAGRKIATSALNQWLGRIKGIAGASVTSGRGFRLLYATQTGTHPPKFLIFCNDAKKLHFSLRRHIENSLREQFEFGGSPLKLEFRSRREGKIP